MKLHSLRLIVILLAAILIFTACAAPQPTPPPVDSMGTIVAELASGMQTQTAAAYSPTPPPMTLTLTPSPTESPTATKDPDKDTIVIINVSPCYFGPGPSYGLESNMPKNKGAKLLGQGSIQGWYIIRNPYFLQPCWVSAADVLIEPDVDLSRFPIMTPGH